VRQMCPRHSAREAKRWFRSVSLSPRAVVEVRIHLRLHARLDCGQQVSADVGHQTCIRMPSTARPISSTFPSFTKRSETPP
jgi:hypothetical protein